MSPALIWTFLAMNVSTDLYLISIPMPLLFTANVTWRKRLALVSVFCCGLFVTAAAILRVILIVSVSTSPPLAYFSPSLYFFPPKKQNDKTKPINTQKKKQDLKNGAFLAGSWAVRETFVAVITTNMPMLFPLFRRWLNPFLGRISSRLGTYGYRGKSTGASSRNLPPHQRAVQTVGKQRMRKQPQQSLNHITNLSVTYANESEERIYELQNVGGTNPAGTGVVTEIIGGKGVDDKGIRVHDNDDDDHHHGEEQDRVSDLSSDLSSSSPAGAGAGIGIQRRVEIVVEEEKQDDPSDGSGNQGDRVLGGNFVAVSSGGGPAAGGAGSGRNRSSTVESRGPGAARTSYFADHVKSENYKRI